jgi:hypothetical protein
MGGFDVLRVLGAALPFLYLMYSYYRELLSRADPPRGAVIAL